jgi:hypothetical protein
VELVVVELVVVVVAVVVVLTMVVALVLDFEGGHRSSPAEKMIA